MKMVKSLLLGSAAGLVAIAGAQAADLPVKAKPVQYVKICSLYGVGFYYIPGTDMCIKIGGWVRAQYMFGLDNGTNGPLVFSTTAPATGSLAQSNGGGLYGRESADGFQWRARGYITADARQQTAYGTARAYIAVGRSGDQNSASAGNNFSSNRAFIQWAGFTFGLAASFYDFFSSPAISYYGGQIMPASDTGDGGNFVAAYTAQFGNGLSASVSAEDWTANRGTAVVNAIAASSGIAVGGGYAVPVNAMTAPTQTYEAEYAPDAVINVRLDQAWGGVQGMAAWHRVGTQYDANTAGSLIRNHASNENGWAAGVGVKLNAPMIGNGDYLQAQFNYTQGALGYLYAGRGNALYGGFRNGGTYGYGVVADGVVTGTQGASSIQLTTGWGINASYEHFWNAQWKTSLYGVYDDVKYNSVANAALCSIEAAYNTGLTTTGVNGGPAAAGCNNNFQNFAVGSRTQWNVTPQFYMGVDVVYQKLQTASSGVTGFVTGLAGAQPSATRTISDQDAWIGYFRVHYDFYP